MIEEIKAIGQADIGYGLPPMVSADDLCASPPETPPEVIEGILHQGSKLALGGGSKALKTWTLLELAICIAKGREWLGFATTQGRVLYLNFELPAFSIEKRIREIREAMGFAADGGNLIVWNLRGHATDAAIILPIISREAKRHGFIHIILDPLYKLLGDRDENSSKDMANLMNAVERMAVETGAAVAFGSHYSKGNQAGKESMDRISGSGVFARDPDSIITMTAHEQEHAFTVEMTLRNFPPQKPFVVRRQHPLMVIDGKLDPTKLKQAGGRKEEVSADEVLAVLGNDALTYSEWLKRAEDQIFISVDTFKRRLRKLKASERIRQSPAEEESLFGPSLGAIGCKTGSAPYEGARCKIPIGIAPAPNPQNLACHQDFRQNVQTVIKGDWVELHRDDSDHVFETLRRPWNAARSGGDFRPAAAAAAFA